MDICTYVLFSLKDRRTYVGSTNDLERRLHEHETGKVNATKNRLPLKLIYSEKFNTISEARNKEHYFKSCSGRKKLRLILDKLL